MRGRTRSLLANVAISLSSQIAPAAHWSTTTCSTILSSRAWWAAFYRSDGWASTPSRPCPGHVYIHGHGLTCSTRCVRVRLYCSGSTSSTVYLFRVSVSNVRIRSSHTTRSPHLRLQPRAPVRQVYEVPSGPGQSTPRVHLISDSSPEHQCGRCTKCQVALDSPHARNVLLRTP